MARYLTFVTAVSSLILASCNVHTANEVKNPFHEKQNKVLLYKSIKPTGWKKLFTSDLLESNSILPTETSLAVLVNEQCLTNQITQSVFGFRETSASEGLKKRSVEQTHKVTLKKALTVKELNKIAYADNCIVGISHNRAAEVSSAYNDPLTKSQSHLKDIRSESTYPFFRPSQESALAQINLAIIDTGLDVSHPDLQDSLWKNEDEFAGQPNVDDDQNGYVDDVYGYNFVSSKGDVSHETFNDHGTHVAGLAAAKSNNGVGITGVMGHGLKVMALNVFGRHLGTETSDIDEAIRYAADNGANVINISVGGPGESETTAAALVYALNKGVVVVASSGNLKQNISDNIYYPASYAERYTGMLAVGASLSGSTNKCDFSNYSDSAVKVFAPGCDASAPKTGLLSTRANGLYGHMKGTSMATPLVAASVAMTIGYTLDTTQKYPTPTEIENIFLSGCDFKDELKPFVKNGCLLNLDNLKSSLSK
jgi:subtilisin family serine protease